MNAEQYSLAAIILAPLTVLGIVGMVRGYHMHIKVWKGDSRKDRDDD